MLRFAQSAVEATDFPLANLGLRRLSGLGPSELNPVLRRSGFARDYGFCLAYVVQVDRVVHGAASLAMARARAGRAFRRAT